MRLYARLKRDSRTGIFHFRVVVPEVMRPHIGQSEKKISLKTRNPAEARLLAYRLNASIFGDEMGKPSLADALAAASSGRPLEARFPDGTVIRTNSPREYQAFHQAVSNYKAQLGNVVPALHGAKAHGLALRQAIQDHLTEIHPVTLPKTLTVKKLAFSEFSSWREGKGLNAALAAVTKQDCYDYKLHLIGQALSPATVTNKLTYLSGFFETMINAGKYPAANPAKGIANYGKKQKRRAAQANGFKPFSQEELALIFSASYPRKDPHSFWGPLIALYTGARISEICQTSLADFFEQDDVFCMSINANGPRKRLKNEASKRIIPLHPKLTELGLRTYLQDVKTLGEKDTFFYLPVSVNGMGNAVSKSFVRYLESLKITTDQGKKSLHSFRSTVIQKLQDAGIAKDFRDAFTGHEIGGIEADHYAKKYSPTILAEKIIPVINWDIGVVPYGTKNFSIYLKRKSKR